MTGACLRVGPIVEAIDSCIIANIPSTGPLATVHAVSPCPAAQEVRHYRAACSRFRHFGAIECRCPILKYNAKCYICGQAGEPGITRIFKNGWFERFARKERIDDSALRDAVQRATSGLIDADLGGGVIKQRVARAGQGKSGGYRTLILFRHGDRAIFAFGFAKSAQANISKIDLALLRDAATEALEWSGEELDRLVASGTLVEIEDDDDNEG